MKLRKLGCLCIVLVILLGMVFQLPMNVNAEEIVASGQWGTGVYWKLDTDGVLTIYGKGKMNDCVTEAFQPWNKHKYPNYPDIVSVVVEEGITRIGSNAFHGIDTLSHVSIADSVISIGRRAFVGCSALTEIVLPDGITGIPEDGFVACSGLQSITIPDNVEKLGDSCFNGCSSLTEVIFGTGLTDIGRYAFAGCKSLRGITIPSGVTTIGRSAFANCTDLSWVSLPKSLDFLDQHAFYNCSNLETVYYEGGRWSRNATDIREKGNEVLQTAQWKYRFKGNAAEETAKTPGMLTKLEVLYRTDRDAFLLLTYSAAGIFFLIADPLALIIMTLVLKKLDKRRNAIA